MGQRVAIMDSQVVLRLKAIKQELARIQHSESKYKLRRTHSPSDKATHEARRTALEAIKVELASLLPAKGPIA